MTRKARRDCSETMLAPGWRLTIAWILVRAWPGEERKTWRSFRGRGEGSPGLPTTRIGGVQPTLVWEGASPVSSCSP